MGKIKLAILCLLLMAGGTAFFFYHAASAPALRELRSAYLTHQAALKKDPQSPALLYNEAWYLIQQGKDKAALQALNQAVQQAPQNPKYLYTRAWLYERLQQPAQAQHDLKSASRHPWTPNTLEEQLRLYAIQGKAAQGLSVVEKEMAKSLNPPLALLFWKMQYQQQLGQNDAALQSLNALAPNPDQLPAETQYTLYRQKAEMLSQQHDYPQAVATLQQLHALKATTASEQDQQKQYMQLLQWQRYTNPEDNLIALQDALKNAPHDKTLHYLRIDTLLEASQNETARSLLIEARNAAPEDPMLWCLQARYQWGQKAVDAALISLKEARERAKDHNSKVCVARESLRQLSEKNTAQALYQWQREQPFHEQLYPALQHPDFKTLRKALEPNP